MTTTHEQTARNAEIVSRRLAGETATDLAREFGVAVTRVSQLVRRHREKSGEIPQRPRTKAKCKSGLPRLRKGDYGLWYCGEGAQARAGETPKAAYDLWLAAGSRSMPLSQRAAPPVLEPYAGPVTVVPGTKVAARPLTIPPAMRFAMERAGLAQAPLLTLGGA